MRSPCEIAARLEDRDTSLAAIYDSGPDGMRGSVICHGAELQWIASWGGKWDHVSVKVREMVDGVPILRTPNWDEMCFIKDLFFQPQETAMQLHPNKSEYVNVHPHCLHIWKPQSKSIPRPPKEFV